MGVGIRLGAGAIVLALWSAPWGIRGAAAEPSESCRDLAARFAAAPQQMDVKELATLGTCLATELAQRVGATAPPAASPSPEQPPAPSAPQGEGAPPSPSGERKALPQARPYGEWPQSAPWMESWPSPNPW